MSLYASYLNELIGRQVLETPKGLVIYSINGPECVIHDIYVCPEYRENREATALADQVKVIAKERGCEWLIGSVTPAANNSHRSLLVLLGYGMKLLKTDGNVVYFGKRINE